MRATNKERILNFFSTRKFATCNEVSKDLGIQYQTVYSNVQKLVKDGLLFPSKSRNTDGTISYSVIPTKKSKIEPRTYKYMGERISLMQAFAILAELEDKEYGVRPLIHNKVVMTKWSLASLMVKAKFPSIVMNPTNTTTEIGTFQDLRYIFEEIISLLEQIIDGGLATNQEMAAMQFGEVNWDYITELRDKFEQHKKEDFSIEPNYDGFEKWANVSYPNAVTVQELPPLD